MHVQFYRDVRVDLDELSIAISISISERDLSLAEFVEGNFQNSDYF